MRLPVRFAFRYLSVLRYRSAISVFAWISVLSFAFGTAALIIILSVFNGFESLVTRLHNSFDPDIKILPASGKVFTPDSVLFNKLANSGMVTRISSTLEENVALNYEESQTIATLKGVDSNFFLITGLDSMVINGYRPDFIETDAGALVGLGIAHYLSINVRDPFKYLEVYVPRRGIKFTTDANKALSRGNLSPTGIFMIEDGVNNKFVVTSLAFARRLLGYDEQVSYLELQLKPGTNAYHAERDLQALLGAAFEVQNRQSQQAEVYRIFRIERWATFLILTFILLVAAVNLIGSLTMMILQKKRDIAILQSIGLPDKSVRRIFLSTGILIALSGALAGLLLGSMVCFLQQKFGFITLGGGNFIISAYPVQWRVSDFILVLITGALVGFITSIIPAYRAPQQQLRFSEE